MAKKISVVIVSYNVCQLLDECLASVERALEGIEGDIFVVDNDSSDGTVATLQPKHPQVHFVANKENVGFARANNQAIRQTDAEYVLLDDQRLSAVYGRTSAGGWGRSEDADARRNAGS